MESRVKNMKHPGQLVCRQRGVGILEVLIALIVVSFGVLGLASLQLTGMKHSSSGYNRSMAVMFVENLATRMRTNEAGVDANAYAGFDSDTLNCGTQPAPYCQAAPGGTAAQACSAAEMAAFDLFSIACGNWSSSGAAEDGATNSLNTGRLQVACDDTPCTPTSNYTLTVTWNEGRTTDNSEDTDLKTVQVRFRP